MNFIRLIIIALVVWLLLKLGKRLFFGRSLPEQKSPEKIASMVKCAYCGLHVPEGEAIKGSSGYYCSEAHKEQAENK
jgi:uncharacterized protein